MQVAYCLAFPFSSLSNCTCAFLQQNLNPLRPNPFSIVDIMQRQPVHNCLHIICTCFLPVQGYSWKLFEVVLPPDNGLMFCLLTPSQPNFLPPVECTLVGMPHRFGNFDPAELRLLQDHSRCAFCTVEVQRIVTVIICIIIIKENLQQWTHAHNCCRFCFLYIDRWL